MSAGSEIISFNDVIASERIHSLLSTKDTTTTLTVETS